MRGSAIASGKLSTNAFVVTHVATAGAALSWAFFEWIYKGKPTTLGAASGAVAGLVAITPASGFVGPMSALIIGLGAGSSATSEYWGKIGSGTMTAWMWLGFTESAAHGELWPPAFLPRKPLTTPGERPFFGDPGLLGIQALTVVTTWVYAFGVTLILLKVLDWTMDEGE